MWKGGKVESYVRMKLIMSNITQEEQEFQYDKI